MLDYLVSQACVPRVSVVCIKALESLLRPHVPVRTLFPPLSFVSIPDSPILWDILCELLSCGLAFNY